MQFLMHLCKCEGWPEECKGTQTWGAAKEEWRSSKGVGIRCSETEARAVHQEKDVLADQGLLVHVLCSKMYLRTDVLSVSKLLCFQYKSCATLKYQMTSACTGQVVSPCERTVLRCQGQEWGTANHRQFACPSWCALWGPRFLFLSVGVVCFFFSWLSFLFLSFWVVVLVLKSWQVDLSKPMFQETATRKDSDENSYKHLGRSRAIVESECRTGVVASVMFLGIWIS